MARDPNETTYRAVEIKTAQVKRLGWSSNLYILEGEEYAYGTGSKEGHDSVRCDITTRVGATRNRIGYLFKTEHPIDGLDPRPNHQHQWEQADGRWRRRPFV